MIRLSRKLTAIGLAVLLLAAHASHAATIAPEKAIRRIENPRDKKADGLAAQTVEAIARERGVPGFAIAVIADFEIHWVKAYGLADVAAAAPVTRDTLFQAASISKPIAAMASVKAAQDGVFSLDADVNSILKSWQVPINEFTSLRAVTPRMLLSHTSGTDDGFGFPGYEPGGPLPTLVQILNGEAPSNLKPVVWAAAPFSRFKYSGGGVILMQLALQDALQRPFEEIARTEILDRVGMKNSFYLQPLPPELEARAARSHFREGKPGNVKYHVYPELAAAGLWTTPEDLCKFAIEIQKTLRGDPGHVLTRDSALQMVTPAGVGRFGAGFTTIEREGHWYFGHSGGNWGVVCNLVASRDTGQGFAIMTNSDLAGGLIAELEKRVAEVYNWPGYGQD